MEKTCYDQEVKLWESIEQRKLHDDLADLYAIIKTTEHLEAAYVRDAISKDEYTDACTLLISQYKTSMSTLSSIVPDVGRFMVYYRLNCPRALERLIRVGAPATVVHNTTSKKSDAAIIAQTVQHFITIMDTLKLQIYAVDQLYPYLVDLVGSLNQVMELPSTFEGKVKLQTWLSKLNRMKASELITEEESRELNFDLEKGYNAFMAFLNVGK